MPPTIPKRAFAPPKDEESGLGINSEFEIISEAEPAHIFPRRAGLGKESGLKFLLR
jgi:hypothetical protein